MSYSNFYEDMEPHMQLMMTATTLLKYGLKPNMLVHTLDELFGFNPMHIEIEMFLLRLDLIGQGKEMKVDWTETFKEKGQ